MKKKKEKNLKGFTLIELLAVIVILAVIALIAVPQVLKILNKARLSAAEDSTMGIVKSAETYVSNFMLQNDGAIPSNDLEFVCDGNSCNLITELNNYNLEGLETLEFKGSKPKSGVVAIRNNGSDIVANNLIINGFRCQSVKGEANCFDKKEGPTSEIPTEFGYTGVLKIVYLDPTDLNKSCDASNINSDTGTKEGCMKWYAYAEDYSTYTMILDHNTTAHVAYNSTNDNRSMKEVATQLTSDTANWVESLNPRLLKPSEVASITNNTTFDETDYYAWYYLDTFTHLEPNPYLQPSQYGWLYDRVKNNCTLRGCLNNSDYEYSGYWLQNSIINSFTLGFVIYDGYIGIWYVNTSDRHGVRPVITVEKSKIS